MADLDRHLERGEKYITKGKFGPAVQEYKAAYDLAPQNLNLLRTLADLCVRAGQHDDAVHYYGELFDKYAEKSDASKGIPLFRKSLQGSPQPPERYGLLGRLLQAAKKIDEAPAGRPRARQRRQSGGAGRPGHPDGQG